MTVVILADQMRERVERGRDLTGCRLTDGLPILGHARNTGPEQTDRLAVCDRGLVELAQLARNATGEQPVLSVNGIVADQALYEGLGFAETSLGRKRLRLRLQIEILQRIRAAGLNQRNAIEAARPHRGELSKRIRRGADRQQEHGGTVPDQHV